MAPSSFDISAGLNSASSLLSLMKLNDQENQMQTVEDMDIDQVMDVPDTPDRMAAPKSNAREEMGKEFGLPVAGNMRFSDLFDKGVSNGVMGSHRLITDNGNTRRLYYRPQKNLVIREETESGNSTAVSASDNLPVSKNAHPFEISKHKSDLCVPPRHMKHVTSSSHGLEIRNHLVNRAKLDGDSSGIAEVLSYDAKIQDVDRGETIDLISSKKNSSDTSNSTSGRNARSKMVPPNTNFGKGKSISTEAPSRYFTLEENNVVDLTGQIKYNRAPGSACSRGVFLAEEKIEGSVLANGCSSLHYIPNSLEESSNVYKGKTKTNDGTYNGAGAHCDHGKGVDLSSDSQPKTKEIMLGSLQSIASPRNTGQKRLVRNGCISPYNIAKAKQPAEFHDKSSKGGEQVDTGKVVSNIAIPCSQIHTVSPNCEGNQTDRVKGKTVINGTIPAKEHGTFLRSSVSHLKEINGVRDALGDDFRCFEEVVGGWRSTRNRSKKACSSLSDEAGHLSKRINPIRHMPETHENRIENKEHVSGLSANPDTGSLEVRDPVSFQRVPAPRLGQASSSVTSELDRENGRHRGANKLIKRQKKHRSACSNPDECSTSTVNDSDVAFLWSSCAAANGRSTRSQNPHHLRNLGPVIEVDEFSPEIRCSNTQGSSPIVNDDSDSDARARQVEADEILARQLQDQLYNEFPGIGGGEIDASIAHTLQLEEAARHTSSLGNQRGSHSRNPSMSHLYREYRSRSSQNPSVRSANSSRARISTRMAQLRNSIHSQSPSMSSGRNFQFPSNMDFETRIHILEALENAVGHNNDMRLASNLSQVQRDFNESDYEMLLALDERNHQQSGTSPNLINGLPLSTLQTDNFEEGCAICLETPTIGDSIRHLPCLHKFHKDCIDTWLRRSTLCPVCKSSIT